MPCTLGANGRIAAIAFATLDSLPAADHNKKIHWVSRVPISSNSLEISAQRMNGNQVLGKPVYRQLVGGPGPSIINLPASGCWRFTVRWSGQADQLDLQYNPPG